MHTVKNRQGTGNTLPAPLLLCCVLVLFCMAGCGRNPLANDRDPYFRRGTKLLQERKFEEAAQAFEKALRFNPDSVNAHLQLGMLYDDVLDDPLAALYHYRLYLRKAPQSQDAETVRKWMERTRHNLLQELAQGSHTPSRDAIAGAPPATQHAGESPARGSETERTLTEQVRRLQALLATLTAGAAGQADAVQPTVRDAAADPAPTHPAPAAEAPRTTAPQTPPPAPRHVAAPSRSPPPPAPPQRSRTHTVQRGDTLSQLARTYYGSLKYWPMIRDANRDVLGQSDALQPGMVLQIPPVEALTP